MVIRTFCIINPTNTSRLRITSRNSYDIWDSNAWFTTGFGSYIYPPHIYFSPRSHSITRFETLSNK